MNMYLVTLISQFLSHIDYGNKIMKDSKNNDSREQIGFWKRFTFFIKLKVSDFWTAILYIIAP